jgi:hypothetical protein
MRYHSAYQLAIHPDVILQPHKAAVKHSIVEDCSIGAECKYLGYLSPDVRFLHLTPAVTVERDADA